MFGKITAHHGPTLIEAQIIAAELPAMMPTTSDGIDNLGSGYTLAPGSVMIVTGTDKRYILGTNSDWEELPAGGGGGDVSGKADKVSGAVSGNLAGLDSSGNLADSGKKPADFEISGTATGTAISITDSADANVQNIRIKGHSEVVSGEIVSVGDNGLTVTTSDGTNTSTASITTGLPLCSLSESIYDVMDNEKVLSNCGMLDLGDLTWATTANVNEFRANVSLKAPYSSAKSALLCSVYALGNSTTRADKTIWSEYSVTPKDIVVKDTAYTDAATFKTAVTGVKLVYPLDVPTETPLTTAEKTALAALRTYSGGTTISATDSPVITVEYLLNTANGEALAKVDDKIPTVFDTTATLDKDDWLFEAQTPEGILWSYQTVNVTGILSTDKPIVDVNVTGYGSGAQEQVDKWGYIGSAETGNGTITFKCYDTNKVPDIDLSVNIKVVR